MREIRELLEEKLLELLGDASGRFSVRDIKEAAAVLRELREMDGPRDGLQAGGVVELGGREDG